MKIIEIAALDNGAHRNQSSSTTTIPDGWAVIPDSMIIPDTFPFVDIIVEGNVVTKMTEGIVPEPQPEPDPEPTAQDDVDAMLIDHEYRLTLLELGVAEDAI